MTEVKDVKTPDGVEINTADVAAIMAPQFYATSMEVVSAGNDFTLTFSRPRQGHHVQGNQRASVAMQEPVFTLSVSPQRRRISGSFWAAR